MSTKKEMTYLDPSWVAQLLNGLEKRVESLKERAMKHAVIVEQLETLSPDELVALLAELCLRAADGKMRSRSLQQELALEPSALSVLSYEDIKKAYRIAAEQEQEMVMGMFMGEPLRGSPTVEESFLGNDYLDTSLGERRFAARSGNRFVLDRLLHDRNHRVIALLLENPKIVERDVVKIAATRPTRPEILELISKHRKWASRYKIRKALSCNPYTPHQVSRRLLGTLMVQDVKMLYNMGALPVSLRKEALRLLSERDSLQAQAAGVVVEVEPTLEIEWDGRELRELAEELLSGLDIEEEEAERVDPLAHVDVEADELALLVAEAERALETSVLVEVGTEPEDPDER
ncbi:MAG: hypothetical protein VX278_19845 [Myxococcota bacterium]|nr:hypothetical protein [Myxococcota bacterium]